MCCQKCFFWLASCSFVTNISFNFEKVFLILLENGTFYRNFPKEVSKFNSLSNSSNFIILVINLNYFFKHLITPISVSRFNMGPFILNCNNLAFSCHLWSRNYLLWLLFLSSGELHVLHFYYERYLRSILIFYFFIIKHHIADAPNTTMYIKPDTFFAVMFLYFFLSVLWVGISVYTYLGKASSRRVFQNYRSRTIQKLSKRRQISSHKINFKSVFSLCKSVSSIYNAVNLNLASHIIKKK